MLLGGARRSAITDRLRAKRWGRYTDPHALCHDHFRLRSSVTHVNYDSMCYVIEALGGHPQTILETGMSAWGTDSTRLFDSYVRSFGGHLWSVDIEPDRVRRLASRVGRQTTLVCDDSAAFLARWVSEHADERAGLVYLDSWDVDFAAPLPAAEHCLRELTAVTPALQHGTVLLIDDSPGTLEDVPEHAHADAKSLFAEFGVWPGKGMLVQQRLSERGISPIMHGYQLLYQF
jgi:hypothetical protein